MESRAINLVDRLYRRFMELEMTYPILAERSGVSVATLKRIFPGSSTKASFANILAIAEALGVSISLKESDVQSLREMQARNKARRIVGMVQGTSALESQGLDEEHIKRMIEQTVHELLAGSSRKLWAS